MLASHHGHLAVVRALLTANADAEARDGNGATALQRASSFGHVEVAQALLATQCTSKFPARYESCGRCVFVCRWFPDFLER